VCRDGGDCGELLKVMVFGGSFRNAMLLAVNKLDSDLVLHNHSYKHNLC
jgi:hypothetical protein